jgi:hypothetical protein
MADHPPTIAVTIDKRSQLADLLRHVARPLHRSSSGTITRK